MTSTSSALTARNKAARAACAGTLLSTGAVSLSIAARASAGTDIDTQHLTLLGACAVATTGGFLAALSYAQTERAVLSRSTRLLALGGLTLGLSGVVGLSSAGFPATLQAAPLIVGHLLLWRHAGPALRISRPWSALTITFATLALLNPISSAGPVLSAAVILAGLIAWRHPAARPAAFGLSLLGALHDASHAQVGLLLLAGCSAAIQWGLDLPTSQPAEQD